MRFLQVIVLLLVYLLNSFTSICIKWASAGEFLGWQYIMGIAAAVFLLALYAVLWQQMLKKIELSTAYMFKGTGVIFVLFYSVFLFGETISLPNILGSILIIMGITLYAKEDIV